MSPDEVFKTAQPGAGPVAVFFQCVFVDADVKWFFQGEGEGGNVTVTKGEGAYQAMGKFENDPVRAGKFSLLAAGKPPLSGKFAHAQNLAVEFMDFQTDRIISNQIPGIASDVAFNSVDSPLRAINTQRCLPVKKKTQQGVEADHVVDVGVRNEKGLNFYGFPWRQRMDISAVEKEGAAAVGETHIECGVAPATIHQFRIKDGSQGLNSSGHLGLDGNKV
jgi:hypothetical protein